MPEFIDKLRVTVRVSRVGEPILEGTFSLAPYSEFHDGPEMLPFQRLSDDATLLLCRADLQWVMAGPGVDPELLRPPTFQFTREERVGVRLRGGDELEGLLQMELPESLNRASDYMNGPEPFFPLTTRQGMFLIQKASARELRLYHSSPLPLPDLAGDR
jgi:hypothetical protein